MTKSYEELLADMTGIIAKIYEKGYDKGYEQGKFSAQLDRIDGMSAEELTKEVQQEKRDRIIEKAKKDVEELKDDYGMYKIYPYACTAEFIVNKDKRTVVAVLRGFRTGKVRARGIAKCSPTDCFNVHIGKVIALRRALSLPIPDEYLNAPQPTEVRVGDVVRFIWGDNEFLVVGGQDYANKGEYHISTASNPRYLDKIIDDSREEASK